MSIAIAHFCFGASCALIMLGIYCELKHKDPEKVDSLVMLIGGIWAMMPDLPFILGYNPYTPPLYCPPAWMNIFFLHSWFDCMDLGDSPVTGVLMVILLAVTIVVIYRHGLRDRFRN